MDISDIFDLMHKWVITYVDHQGFAYFDRDEVNNVVQGITFGNEYINFRGETFTVIERIARKNSTTKDNIMDISDIFEDKKWVVINVTDDGYVEFEKDCLGFGKFVNKQGITFTPISYDRINVGTYSAICVKFDIVPVVGDVLYSLAGIDNWEELVINYKRSVRLKEILS